MGGLPTGCASYSPALRDRPQHRVRDHRLQHHDRLARRRHVGERQPRRLVEARVLEAELPRLRVHRRRQLRRRQLHRAPQRRDRAVVRSHHRRVQQIAVRQRHPLQQARLRAALGDLGVVLVDGRQPLQLEPLVHHHQHRRQLRDRRDGAFLVGVAREDDLARLVEHQRRRAWTFGCPDLVAATCRSTMNTTLPCLAAFFLRHLAPRPCAAPRLGATAPRA